MTDPVIDQVREAFNTAMAQVRSPADLQAVRHRFLNRTDGEATSLVKLIASRPAADRKAFGSQANALKQDIEAALEARRTELEGSTSILAAPLDTTVPGLAPPNGGLHPTIQMMYDLNDAFMGLNFAVFEGPEVTSELYEFDHMNFPPDHPARESMDSYWLEAPPGARGADRLCIRPHLTGASVRYMQRHTPPFRFVYPGRVFRNETTDARHERAFFQYEALIVERDLPFSAGQLLIRTVLSTVFGRPVRTRMRAGFFPFVEPGFEIDMECLVCGGAGCKVCKQVGWLEVMPGGMPHPNVLRAGGVDPDQWMGFYVNVGLDRLVMMRYGIDDVRLFHSADLRFLEQFS